MQFLNWLRENWLRVHVALVPIGTLAATWLLQFAVGQSWQWWQSSESIAAMGQAIPLGAAIYGSLISILEGIVRMFWALGQIAKDIDKWRSEGREQGREQGLKEGLELARKEREQGRQEGREAGRQEVLKQLAEQNIDLPQELLKEINGPNEPRQS